MLEALLPGHFISSNSNHQSFAEKSYPSFLKEEIRQGKFAGELEPLSRSFYCRPCEITWLPLAPSTLLELRAEAAAPEPSTKLDKLKPEADLPSPSTPHDMFSPALAPFHFRSPQFSFCAI